MRSLRASQLPVPNLVVVPAAALGWFQVDSGARSWQGESSPHCPSPPKIGQGALGWSGEEAVGGRGEGGMRGGC